MPFCRTNLAHIYHRDGPHYETSDGMSLHGDQRAAIVCKENDSGLSGPCQMANVIYVCKKCEHSN